MSIVASTTYTSTSAGISTLISNSTFSPKAIAVNGNYIFILNNSNYAAVSRIIYSTNAGSTWNRTTSTIILDNLLSISVSQNGYVLVCGNSGIYYSNNAGVTFVNLTPPYTGSAVGVISNDGSTLYVGNCGGAFGVNNFNNVWRANTSINPNSWTVSFGNPDPTYNNASNWYKSIPLSESNSAIATNSDGTYLVGAAGFQTFLGKNNVFINPWPAPVGSGNGWDYSAISKTGQFILFNNSHSYIPQRGIWYSNNYGLTFTRVLPSVLISFVELDKDAGKVIFGYSTNPSILIYYSTNSGATFNSFVAPSNVRDIKYNPSNFTLYMGTNNTLLTYTLPLLPPTVTINGTTVAINGTYTAIARTSSVNVVVTSNDPRTVTSTVGTTNLIDDLNIITITMSDNTIYNVYVMVLRNCFLEGTKILCCVDNEEKYIPVEEMKEGTLVKTFLNGYIPVHTIGHSNIYNPANKLRGENRLYKRTKEQYPEITEDLIITGCHSVLVDVDRITPEVRKKTMDLFKHETMATDTKYRLLTCLDERADTYEVEGTFPIWHFALDHYDIYMNYGIYANGLLVETCSINMMREHSGLQLI
jgi:hypothetical protein